MSMHTHSVAMPFDDLMRLFEGFRAAAYDDGQRKATIGIGTNIRDNRQYLALVLRKLGVFAASDARVIGPEVGAQRDQRCAARPSPTARLLIGSLLKGSTCAS
jgi:hypothetical protein